MNDRATKFVEQFCARNSSGLPDSDKKLMARMLRKEYLSEHKKARIEYLARHIRWLRLELNIATVALGLETGGLLKNGRLQSSTRPDTERTR